MDMSLLEDIKKKFEESLQTKTGWGRNEILREYDKAVNAAVLTRMMSVVSQNSGTK